jgi:hypothetical protein
MKQAAMRQVSGRSRLRLVVLGWIIRGPAGGIAWHYLNYVLGLAELGYDVYYIEDSDDVPCCMDPALNSWNSDPTYGLCFASAAFARLGLGDRWAYYDAHTNEWKGARARDARELCQTADLILNISGVNPVREWLERVPARVLIDTDPGLTQIRNLTDPAFRRRCEAHTAFFSFGENIGKPCSSVPDDGFPWRATRQPVSMSAWPCTAGPAGGRYTTVMHWRGGRVFEYGALRLGKKSESFGPFIGLPQRLGGIFEIAVRGGKAPLAALREANWGLADIDAVSRDPWTYQYFIQRSKAEFGIAKQGYVATRCGWFSERSAVYLASGRPVLHQDTGFPECLPCGRGVIPFQSLDDVIDAVADVDGNYQAHCRAARELAEEYFAAIRVLPALIEAAMAPLPARSPRAFRKASGAAREGER